MGALGMRRDAHRFQSPLGDFGFLKLSSPSVAVRRHAVHALFQSPLGDFGFLKVPSYPMRWRRSFPIRFNPLSGILVF